MSANSSIEWTDRTWNPVRGCSVISPGCVNCYAMKQAHRFSGEGRAYEGLTKLTKAGPQWTGVIRTIDSALLEPLSWRTPQRVFVNSMSDLFHENVPDAFIDRVFTVMALSPWHTYQVLTKRADRMRAFLNRFTMDRLIAVANAQPDGSAAIVWLHENLTTIARRAKERAYRHEPHLMPLRMVLPLPNVWLGVSVEDQQRADERIPLLLQTPAAVRFISYEPALGPVDLTNYLWTIPGARLNRLHWVIVGGESGHGARPFDVAWARWIIAQGRSSDVPVFVKQLGSVITGLNLDGPPFASPPRREGFLVHWTDRKSNTFGLCDRKGGDMAEWPEDLRVREFPR